MSSTSDSHHSENIATNCVHAGVTPDVHSGAVMTPISLSSTFLQKSPGQLYPGGYEYSRSSNPTRDTFEKNVAACEGAKYGLAFASGLAATATIIMTLEKGSEVITFDDVYGGSGRYFSRIAEPHAGVSFKYVDLVEEKNFEEAITDKTKLLWIETPTNPMLKVANIAALSKIAHKHNIIVVVDNTFLSPYFQNPLKHGADIVLHSVSKYINGHSDVVMGWAGTNSDDIYKRLKFIQNGAGGIPSPFDSYLALRGMKTLAVRMKQHGKNAIRIAKFLEDHDKVEKVIYPGLESHPQHELAKKQQRGYGGVVTVILKGDIKAARAFMENLELFSLAESLGGVESLANHPAIMTHASVPIERRKKLGITDALVRLSVGIEKIEDLLEDIKNALSHIQ